MKTHRWQDVKNKRIKPERAAEIRAQVEQEVLDLNLAAVASSSANVKSTSPPRWR